MLIYMLHPTQLHASDLVPFMRRAMMLVVDQGSQQVMAALQELGQCAGCHGYPLLIVASQDESLSLLVSSSRQVGNAGVKLPDTHQVF